MDTETKDRPDTTPWWVGRTSGSYDPTHPTYVEARKYDDNSDGLDWEEILLTTQEDFEAGRYCYNSEDYATHAEADAALDAWLDAIAEKAEREPAHLHMMPRVDSDIRQCLDFEARRSWGELRDRKLGLRCIRRGIDIARGRPEASPIVLWRAGSRIWLRRCNSGPFVIVYAYLDNGRRFPYSVVSIRAVRLSSVNDVFAGVDESMAECAVPETQPT